MCLKVYVQSVAVKSNAFVSSFVFLKKKFSHFLNPKYTLNISGVCFSLVSFLRDVLSREKERQNTHTKVVNASSLCACTRIIIRDGRKRKEYF